MLRLILLILFFAAMLVFAGSVVAVFKALVPSDGPSQPAQEDRIPPTMKRVAYVMLVILLFGLSLGWLGAA